MVKVMVLLLIVAFAGLFFIEGPNGKPMLSLSDLKPEVPNVPKLPESLTGSVVDSSEGTTSEVYKWQDADGQWHYSNKPKDKGNGEVMIVDGDINIIPAVDPAVIAKLNRKAAAPKQAQTKSFKVPEGMTSVSGDKVEAMMDTVNGLQDTVDARKKALDKLTAGG